MEQNASLSPRVYFKTYGCQMNELDSGKMARLLEQDGWEVVSEVDHADAIIVNTCTVREKPAHKVNSLLGEYRALKKRRPSLRIVIAGCFAVQEGAGLLRRQPHVSAVIGSDAVSRVAEIMRRTSVERVCDVGADEAAAFVAEPVSRGSHGITAFVAIQRGCDHGCSYCIVPQVRGNERYRPLEDVVDEVERLFALGARDVTLLGQNVNRYQGLENAQAGGGTISFARLLRRVAALDASLRVRFTTSNPWDLGEELVQALGELDNVCPYLHLPVQSGSDRVLQRMGRHHTAAEYLDLVERLRRARPGLALSSDIMVGFPGETDEDYRATMDLVKQVRFSNLFVFAYSSRPGTVAAGWPDDVPREEKLHRLRAVLDAQDQITSEKLHARVGETARVLFEERGREEGAICGRTPDFRMVHARGPADWIGQEKLVRLDEALRHTFRGTVVQESRSSAPLR